MTHTPVDIYAIIDKRMKEIKERLASKREGNEAPKRRQTRSQADKPGTSGDTEVETVPMGSLRKWKQQEDRKDVGRKKPKTPERKDVGGKKPKTPERKNIGGKKPKTPERKDKGGKKPKVPEHTDKGTKWPKTPANSSKATEEIDDIDKAESQKKRQKKTMAIPLLEEDDDNADDDLMVIDDKDKDEDYEPQDDEQDDEDYPILDDDDFQEPPPQARKPVKKEQVKKQSTQQCVDKSSKEDTADIDDETLSLFQRIVGDNFEIKASEEFEQETKDRCMNPVEAAGFRATMKMLALELKKAVKKGKRVKETYEDLIVSTIRITKAMKYPSVATVETKDILNSIQDLECNAWKKHMQGISTMEPEEIVMEGDVPENEEDLVIQGPILTEEATQAAVDAIQNLPLMLIADTKVQFRTLFAHIEKVHRHAAEATKTLRELHDKLPLEVFLWVADCAV